MTGFVDSEGITPVFPWDIQVPEFIPLQSVLIRANGQDVYYTEADAPIFYTPPFDWTFTFAVVPEPGYTWPTGTFRVQAGVQEWYECPGIGCAYEAVVWYYPYVNTIDGRPATGSLTFCAEDMDGRFGDRWLIPGKEYTCSSETIEIDRFPGIWVTRGEQFWVDAQDTATYLWCNDGSLHTFDGDGLPWGGPAFLPDLPFMSLIGAITHEDRNPLALLQSEGNPYGLIGAGRHVFIAPATGFVALKLNCSEQDEPDLWCGGSGPSVTVGALLNPARFFDCLSGPNEWAGLAPEEFRPETTPIESTFGAQNPGHNADAYYAGLLDEIILYNRILTPNEIASVAALLPPSAGLIAHYPLDGTADDSSGNDNNGTEFGALVYGPGVMNEAAVFDGLDDYIRLAQPLGLTGTDYTLALWTKSTDPASYMIHSWSPEEPGQPGNETESFVITPTPQGQVMVIQAGKGVFTFPSTLDDQWHHLALSRSHATMEFRGYLDGQLVGTSRVENDCQRAFDSDYDYDVDVKDYTYQQLALVPLPPDCNGNGINDDADIQAGVSQDCNADGIPDECQTAGDTDCNTNGVLDECEPDCNSNGIADACDITDGTSMDCNTNGLPDECETDCNTNGIPDDCDIASGSSEDDDGNGIPDECDTESCLDCGLIAYYPFDGNSDDYSGLGNDGVEQGGIVYVSGVLDGAVSFDGLDDLIVLASPLGVNGTDYSLALWIKSNDPGAYVIHSWAADNPSEPGNEQESFIIMLTGSRLYIIQSGEGVVPILDLLDDEWHHVVFMRRLSDMEFRAYLDGVLVGTATATRPETDPLETAYGGSAPSADWDAWFDGALDELRVYDRRLTLQEIMELATR